MTLRTGTMLTCRSCPFVDDCEYVEPDSIIELSCKVIDYHNSYATVKSPMERTQVFVVQHGANEDVIPTEKEVAPQSVLDEARDKTLEED